MDTIADVLKTFDPVEDKYVSREFQAFGVHLAKKLQDGRRKSMYIKFARDIPRSILEEALRYVVDSKARSKGALFMWKLKDMGAFEKYVKKKRKSKKKSIEE
ncbi:hypothetical protein KC726_05590 [Candidatus Woesebacteria bacterium]|nr:hypothetical protein [Candidatus Woesebacteria bacterium]